MVEPVGDIDRADQDATPQQPLPQQEPGEPADSARSSARRGEVVLDWKLIAKCATGCGPEYIPRGGERGMRLMTTGAHAVPSTTKRSTPLGDATQILQDGVPVLFYHPMARVFEQRVLKVDRKLRFLFVLLDSTNVKSSMYQDPIVLRLRQIALVHGTDMAVNLCQAHNISDSELDSSSAVVVQSRTDQETPPFDKLMIFLAPPQLHLKARLDECIVHTTHNEVLVGQEASVVEPLTASGDARKLDGLRLKDVSTLFAIDSKFLNFEIAFRPQGSKGDGEAAPGTKKQPIIYPVRLPLSPEACDREVARLETKVGTLPVVDAARAILVLQEVATIRQWVMVCSRTVDAAFYRLLTDGRSVATVAKMDFREAEHMCEPPKKTREFEAADDLGGAALRAITCALKQFLDLERMHAHLSRGANFGDSPVLGAIEAPEKAVPDKAAKTRSHFAPVGRQPQETGTSPPAAIAARSSAELENSEGDALLASKETLPAPPAHKAGALAALKEEEEEREQAALSARSTMVMDKVERACEPNSLLEQLSKYKWTSRSCA